MSTIDRPEWKGPYEDIWRSEWHGMELFASPDGWELYQGGQKITGGVWRQQHGQRPAGAAVRLRENQDRCFNAAWRRTSNAN